MESAPTRRGQKPASLLRTALPARVEALGALSLRFLLHSSHYRCPRSDKTPLHPNEGVSFHASGMDVFENMISCGLCRRNFFFFFFVFIYGANSFLRTAVLSPEATWGTFKRYCCWASPQACRTRLSGDGLCLGPFMTLYSSLVSLTK